MKRKGRGEVTKVSDLFAVYKNKLKAPEGTVITTTQEIIHDMFGFNLPKEAIRYKVSSKTLTITAPGPLKTEIKLQQKEILTHLKGRLGASGAPTTIL